jgi:SAM-dependent methyltransferase
MKSSVQCPLCESQLVSELQTIKTSELQAVYRWFCGHTFEDEFGKIKEVSLCRCENCDLRFFHPFVVGSAKFYAQLQKSLDWYYPSDKHEYHWVAKKIPNGARILEIGSGEGHFVKFVSSSRYTGIEINESASNRAREKGIDVRLEALADHSKAHAGEYDVVCSFQVLEHIDRVQDFLKHSAQCVKPGGHLFITVPNLDSALKYSINSVLNLPPHHQTWWNDRAFGAAARLLGMSVVEIYHEPLAEEHRMLYLGALMERGIRKFLRMPERMIDRSLSGKLVSKAASTLAGIANLAMDDIEMRPMGISMTAVMRK